MTPTRPAPAAHASPAAIAFVHTVLPAAERWRCAVRDRGCGMVTGRVDLLGTATGFDVDLDHGERAHVLPSQLRPLPPLVRP